MSALQQLFSVENVEHNGDKIKIVNFMGLKIKQKKKSKLNIIYGKRFSGLTHEELKYLITTQFKNDFGYEIDLNNPQTFNEKLTWEKLYYDNPLMTVCADKVKGRDYFLEKINQGENHLVKQLGLYKSPDDIDFETLPKQFVLKSNWGSGAQIIVKDKDSEDISRLKEIMKNWMDKKSNHYYMAFERGYKDIEPWIVCEELLNFEYKLEFFCFNGEPKFFWIVLNDKTKEVQANFYELNWQRIPLSNHYPNFAQTIEKTACYEEILSVAKQLCGDFPFVRCDFYITKDSWRFSEMTFYHWGATQKFTPEKYDLIFGQMMKLPPKNEGNKG